MSDPSLTPDAMLARLAAFDMAGAEHAHARFMAAEEAVEVERLGRTYERAARSLRRTLALQAKLQREAAVEARRAELIAERNAVLAGRFPARGDADEDDVDDPLVDALVERLRAEYDPSEAERLEMDLEDHIDRMWTGDVGDLPVEGQVEAVMAHIHRVAPPKAQAAPALSLPDWEGPGGESIGVGECDAGRPADRLASLQPPDSPNATAARSSPPYTGRESAASPPADPPPPEQQPAPPEPDPPPPPPPPEPWPEPYIPPWEKLRPGQRWPGGSGW